MPSYVFHFGAIVENLDRFLAGAWVTIHLSLTAMLIGLALAIVCALTRSYGPRWGRWIVATYVEVIRNTPLLVQLFVIFFGLPDLGVRITPYQAALLGIVINLGAYATEIVRAGIEAVPRGQIEAGRSLGLTRIQVLRLIVLMPAIETVYPALASQFVLVMLGSSIVSMIAVEDLSAVATSVQSETFRAFEVYAAIGVIYLALALAFRMLLGSVDRVLFESRRQGRGRPQR